MRLRVAVALLATAFVLWTIYSGGMVLFLVAIIPAVALSFAWSWWRDRVTS